jgi:hypothetical protein
MNILMKRFLKTMAFMLVLTGVFACSPEEDLAPQSLEVTPNNVSGVWKLADVNGEALPQGVYCYMEFVRRDRTFTMYQKFDSMYPRRLTGSFDITKDEYKGYILSGKYDYGTGDWNNSYIVTSLFEESMLLTVDAVNGDVCKYVRCNEVPAEIIGWFETGNAN